MNEPKVSYEEFIPTDRFTIQDMYFWGIQLLRQDYAKLMRGWYNNQSKDARALIDFYADADGFFFFAHQNIKKFSSPKDVEFLENLFVKNNVQDLTKVETARQVFQMLMRFGSDSKLTALSESRPMGDFAYARAKLGITPGRRDDEGKGE